MNEEEWNILLNMIFFMYPNDVTEKNLFEFLHKVANIEEKNDKKELEKELNYRQDMEKKYDNDTKNIFSQLVNEHLIKYTKFREDEVYIQNEINKDNLYLYKNYEMFHNKLVNILSELYEKTTENNGQIMKNNYNNILNAPS